MTPAELHAKIAAFRSATNASVGTICDKCGRCWQGYFECVHDASTCGGSIRRVTPTFPPPVTPVFNVIAKARNLRDDGHVVIDICEKCGAWWSTTYMGVRVHAVRAGGTCGGAILSINDVLNDTSKPREPITREVLYTRAADLDLTTAKFICLVCGRGMLHNDCSCSFCGAASESLAETVKVLEAQRQGQKVREANRRVEALRNTAVVETARAHVDAEQVVRAVLGDGASMRASTTAGGHDVVVRDALGRVDYRAYNTHSPTKAYAHVAEHYASRIKVAPAAAKQSDVSSAQENAMRRTPDEILTAVASIGREAVAVCETFGCPGYSSDVSDIGTPCHVCKRMFVDARPYHTTPDAVLAANAADAPPVQKVAMEKTPDEIREHAKTRYKPMVAVCPTKGCLGWDFATEAIGVACVNCGATIVDARPFLAPVPDSMRVTGSHDTHKKEPTMLIAFAATKTPDEIRARVAAVKTELDTDVVGVCPKPGCTICCVEAREIGEPCRLCGSQIIDARPHISSSSPKKEPTMPTETPPASNLNPMLKTLEVDATEAAWRMAGSQFARLSRDPIVALLSRHLGPDDDALRGRIAAFLETELGASILAGVLSAGLSAMPANEITPRLSRELRVKSMAGVGDAIASILMDPLMAVATTYLRGMPVTTPPTADPLCITDGVRLPVGVGDAATVERA